MKNTIASIPASRVAELEAGLDECRNLMEELAVDQIKLAHNVGIKMLNPSKMPVSKMMRQVASYIDNWQEYANHKSSIVRGWACYSLALNSELNFADKCEHMKIFAASTHYGVREWAWLALRDELIKNLEQAIEILQVWAKNPDENIRRFASEATRPKGVWSAHIKVLKENPSLGLPILEPLKSDPSLYVDNSVANWLNDVAKIHPEWLKQLCNNWQEQAQNQPNSQYTARIIKRALRNLN